MQESNQTEFMKVISQLAAIFERTSDESFLDGYWMALNDLEWTDFKHAALLAAREMGFMPRPADIRNQSSRSRSNIRETISRIWPDIVLLAQCSSDEHPDPIAKEALARMGGGKVLGQMKEQDLQVWGRKQFGQFYTEISEHRSRTPETLRLKSNSKNAFTELASEVASKLSANET